MKLDLGSLLDILFPRSRDEIIMQHARPETFKMKLNIQEIKSGLYALSSFKDPEVRAAIHLVKFHAHKEGAKLLGILFAHYLTTLPVSEYAIIPIPLSRERLRQRGHNQVLTIASEARGISCELLPHVLVRVRNTTPQTSLSKQEREQNLTNAFAQHPASHRYTEGKHIILLDDVTTTGTTLSEAKKALAGAKALSIRMVAIAH